MQMTCLCTSLWRGQTSAVRLGQRAMQGKEVWERRVCSSHEQIQCIEVGKTCRISAWGIAFLEGQMKDMIWEFLSRISAYPDSKMATLGAFGTWKSCQPGKCPQLPFQIPRFRDTIVLTVKPHVTDSLQDFNGACVFTCCNSSLFLFHYRLCHLWTLSVNPSY